MKKEVKNTARIEYLQAVCDSQISPVEVFMKQQETPGSYYVIDVRIGNIGSPRYFWITSMFDSANPTANPEIKVKKVIISCDDPTQAQLQAYAAAALPDKTIGGFGLFDVPLLPAL